MPATCPLFGFEFPRIGRAVLRLFLSDSDDVPWLLAVFLRRGDGLAHSLRIQIR
jgi:hypothetical protein